MFLLGTWLELERDSYLGAYPKILQGSKNVFLEGGHDQPPIVSCRFGRTSNFEAQAGLHEVEKRPT